MSYNGIQMYNTVYTLYSGLCTAPGKISKSYFSLFLWSSHPDGVHLPQNIPGEKLALDKSQWAMDPFQLAVDPNQLAVDPNQLALDSIQLDVDLNQLAVDPN